MGADDDLDCLTVVDRWLVHDIDIGLEAVIRQQNWGLDALPTLKAAWGKVAGLHPGQGYIHRGYGWRVWLRDGTVLDCRHTYWSDVPESIVLVVNYLGPLRFLSQGRDPYWLHDDGHHHVVYDSRTPAPPGMLMKQGVWVTDPEMQAFRWRATLAFTLRED